MSLGSGDDLVVGLDFDDCGRRPLVWSFLIDQSVRRPSQRVTARAVNTLEVGLDRVAFVVVDRPRTQIRLGHAEALLDLRQLVVGGITYAAVGLPGWWHAVQPDQRPGLDFQVAVHALANLVAGWQEYTKSGKAATDGSGRYRSNHWWRRGSTREANLGSRLPLPLSGRCW